MAKNENTASRNEMETILLLDPQPHPKQAGKSRSLEIPKITLQEAFNQDSPFADEPTQDLDLAERGVRSVAFLAHWLCDQGMNELEGATVQSLAEILDRK